MSSIFKAKLRQQENIEIFVQFLFCHTKQKKNDRKDNNK